MNRREDNTPGLFDLLTQRDGHERELLRINALLEAEYKEILLNSYKKAFRKLYPESTGDPKIIDTRLSLVGGGIKVTFKWLIHEWEDEKDSYYHFIIPASAVILKNEEIVSSEMFKQLQ